MAALAVETCGNAVPAQDPKLDLCHEISREEMREALERLQLGWYYMLLRCVKPVQVQGYSILASLVLGGHGACGGVLTRGN